MNEQNDVSVVNTEPTNDSISVVGAADPAQETAPQDPQQVGTPSTEGDPQQTDQAQTKSTDQETKSETKSDDKPAVPEKYEFVMPEGFNVDETAMEQITPVLKDLGLSQEAAQKLADFHFAQMKAYEEAQVKAREETIAQWEKELRADKEIGGPDIMKNLMYGTRLLNRFGSADLDTLLKESGLDRNPTMVRFLVAVGKEFAEDRWADGGKHGPAAKTAEAVAKQIFDKTF